MPVTDLAPQQLAISRSRNIAVNNPPTITFTGDARKITMRVEISFKPDQFNSNPVGGADIPISITTGDCAVFNIGSDTFDLNRTTSITFKAVTGDLITLVVPDVFTIGIKGNHGS